MANSLMIAGGPVTAKKLRDADLEPSQALEGKTFFAGTKEVKTGTMVDRPAQSDPVSIRNDDDTAYFAINPGAYIKDNPDGYNRYPELTADKSWVITNALGLIDRSANNNAALSSNFLNNRLYVRIPRGVYRTNGPAGYPEVYGNPTLFTPAVRGQSIAQYKANLTDTGGSVTHTFSMRARQVILFVLHGARTDNGSTTLSLTTPGCTNLFNYDSGIYTQDIAYMANRILVRVVRVNSNGIASATITDPNNTARAVGFIGAWRLMYD